ncbi:MAG TPA: hypothetical protein VGR12_05400 [Solirubrobacteraceae bacterium]|nr:hypothetical protein [Solirubrobacteraceae bacterium]
MAREGAAAARTEAVVSADLDALPDRLRALCSYAFKLTLRPWEMNRRDVEALRGVGLSDRDIVDANQVVAYYNYVNRVADGLGVQLEPEWPAEERAPRRYAAREAFRGDGDPAM